MATLYITEQGTTVTKSGERLLLRKDGKLLQELPAMQVEQIVVFGNAHFTAPAVSFVLNQGIDVAYLTAYGMYRGRLQQAPSKDAALRQAQYQRAAEAAFCLETAKHMVHGKITNSLVLVQRQKPRGREVKDVIRQLRRALDNLDRASDLDTVRGHEGAAAAAHFRAFRQGLKVDLGFRHRAHRPPPDPVNVLLSLGYTLLHNQVFAAINVVGLDPYLGFFHQTRHGHATLASDLMEEWRAVLVDSLVLGLVNRQEIGAADFRTSTKGRVRLLDEARGKFLRAYDARLRTPVVYPATQEQTPYLRCLELQVRHLARVLTNREPAYVPYRTR